MAEPPTPAAGKAEVLMEGTKHSRNISPILVSNRVFKIYKELRKGRREDLEGKAIMSINLKARASVGDEWSQH